MSEDDSGHHPDSFVVFAIVVVMNFLFLNFSQTAVWMFLGQTPTKFVVIKMLPLFIME